MNLQCDELRGQLLLMQKQIFELKQKNAELLNRQCNNIECPNRKNYILPNDKL